MIKHGKYWVRPDHLSASVILVQVGISACEPQRSWKADKKDLGSYSLAIGFFFYGSFQNRQGALPVIK